MTKKCWDQDPAWGSCFPPSRGTPAPVCSHHQHETHPRLAGTGGHAAAPSPPWLRQGAPRPPSHPPTLLTWVLCSPMAPQPPRHPLRARPASRHAPRPHPWAPVTHPCPREGRTLEQGLPLLPTVPGVPLQTASPKFFFCFTGGKAKW